MTEFTHRISYTVHRDNINAANQFMSWVGYGPGDINTFRMPETGDYAYASGQYKDEFVTRLGEPLTEDNRPAWGADLDIASARSAQAALGYVINETNPTVEVLSATAVPSKVTTTLKGVANGDPDNPPDWATDTAYAIGDLCGYNGITYMCIQAHTSIVTWTPDVVPALFVVIPNDANIWQIGVQYVVDQIVLYEPNGLTYKCIQAHTSQAGWEPPNVPALWGETGASAVNVADLYGPFTLGGKQYWVATSNAGDWYAGLDLDEDGDPDVWASLALNFEPLFNKGQRRAIRNKAKKLGWTP